MEKGGQALDPLNCHFLTGIVYVIWDKNKEVRTLVKPFLLDQPIEWFKNGLVFVLPRLDIWSNPHVCREKSQGKSPTAGPDQVSWKNHIKSQSWLAKSR